ncbi:MAG: phosphate/phosphite/phosphonate ABC transporter substrate-binding protein [Gammaproteobacteria bacterium]|nr:phosphate/phosphite/phosphonate ABC transporter substrate-binding protein [Gammaproteobacteria bacterium]
MKKQIFTILFAVSVCILPAIVKADLIFSAPPREKPAVGEQLYGPIAESLSVMMGEKVVYKHPRDWLTYSMKMRRGDYDLVFDGPQFSSWRMQHIQHVPLVRLQGHLGFLIITKNDSGVNTIQDLIAKKICGLASPNLATISMLREFKNPVRQPIFVETKGGMKGIYNKLKSGKCVAAVMRDGFYNNKLSDEVKAQYKIIWKSKRMPNQTITASKRIPAELRDQIVASLTTERGSSSAAALFKRFSKKSKQFIAANDAEYNDLNNLLEGVVWGW